MGKLTPSGTLLFYLENVPTGFTAFTSAYCELQDRLSYHWFISHNIPIEGYNTFALTTTVATVVIFFVMLVNNV